MNKKKTVMRRLAALLIASLVFTSSAFNVLAASTSGETTKYYQLEAVGNESLTLQAGGKTGTLEVAIKPTASPSDATVEATNSNALEKKEVTWTSDNEKVATVTGSGKSCTVTPVAKGNAKITASVEDTNLSKEFTVTVNAGSETTDPSDPSKPTDPSEPENPSTPSDAEKVTLELDKEEMTLEELKSGVITVSEVTDGAKIEWTIISGSDVVDFAAKGNESATVFAKKEGVAVIQAEANKGSESATYDCQVTVTKYQPDDGEADVTITVPDLPDDPEAAEAIVTKTNDIVDAVRDVAKAADVADESVKETLANIPQVPEGSELKLRSVDAELEVEKDADGKPVVGEDGKPVVVVKTLTYDIGLVDKDGKKLPHSTMAGNNRYISVNVNLPKVGIKSEWKYATIKHYDDDMNLLETLYSAIFGDADNKRITIRTRTFSPFVMNFTVDNPNPPTSSGGSGGGGGSSSSGGSKSTSNSYAMTGNWVADANGWKFVKSNGSTAVNTWGYINGQYYYFDAAGTMVTGWYLVNGKWYYMNPAAGSAQGVMLTGVIFDPVYNAYFYADASGAMVTGWYQVGANWYYFSPINDGVHVQGALLADTTIDGYYVGADGAWVPAN